jgi:hypothetical protein
LGSDNFTFEFWTYLNSTDGHFINKRVSTGASVQYLYLRLSGGSLILWATSNGSSWDIASNFGFGNTTMSTGQWYHIALVRNGTEISTYVDGTKSPNTITTSAAIHNGSTNPLRIAGDVPYNGYLNGYIDDLRITKGVARYTSNFTPPTAQLPGAETGTFASGFWTSSDHIKQIRSELWPGLVPSIVTDGLVLHLDAGDSASYPGSGTTWTDLSGNGNNGTISGATYSSNESGYLDFDGSNDYVNLGSFFTFSNFTISLWVYPGSTQTTYADIFDNNHTGTQNFVCQQNANNVNQYSFGVSGSSGTSLFTLSANVWQYLTFTYNNSVASAYINGAFHSSGAPGGPANYVNPILNIARWSSQYGGRHWNGRVSYFTAYNKVLTASEITQNYNALKGRYGL